MLAATYGTVSDIEIVWTLIALIGIGFGIFNLRDAILDRRAIVAANVRNGRRTIANYAIRQETARIFIQVLFATVGGLSMALPEPPKTPPLNTFSGLLNFFALWAFITAASLLLAKSIDSYVTRHKITGNGH